MLNWNTDVVLAYNLQIQAILPNDNYNKNNNL